MSTTAKTQSATAKKTTEKKTKTVKPSPAPKYTRKAKEDNGSAKQTKNYRAKPKPVKFTTSEPHGRNF